MIAGDPKPAKPYAVYVYRASMAGPAFQKLRADRGTDVTCWWRVTNMCSERGGLRVSGPDHLEGIADDQLVVAYAALGRMIERCSALDASLTALLGAITGIGEIGAHELLLHAIDANRKLELIKLIGRSTSEAVQADVERLAKKAGEVLGLRNLAAHAIFVVYEGELVLTSLALTRVMHEDRSKCILEAARLDHIAEKADRLAAIANELTAHFESFVPQVNDEARAYARRMKV